MAYLGMLGFYVFYILLADRVVSYVRSISLKFHKSFIYIYIYIYVTRALSRYKMNARTKSSTLVLLAVVYECGLHMRITLFCAGNV